MTSIYFYELVLLFFIFHHNFYSGHIDNFFKGYVTRNSFSSNKHLIYDSFIYYEVNIFNISHTNVFSSSDRFYPFKFYFCKHRFFICSVFNDIFYVNNITNIFDNNLYITGLLNWDNKPKPKPITIGVFYTPPNLSESMDLMVEKFSNLNLKDNMIYFLDDFNINLFQNGKHILNGKRSTTSQRSTH